MRVNFSIYFQNKTVVLDFDYFVQLFEQFYLSDDPSDLGNFINGKLDYNQEEDSDGEDEDPGLEDHKIDSNASLDSMDSDMKKHDKKPTSKIQQLKKRILMVSDCCVIL